VDTKRSYRHEDTLAFLNERGSLRQKLVKAHETLREQLPFVARIALALYDPESETLKTYLHSSEGDSPLEGYEAVFAQATSLREILARGRPRIIDDMVALEDGLHEHTTRIGSQGYGASYTMPVFNHGAFLGFLFFNSYEKDVFTDSALQVLDIYGHLISLLVVNELSSLESLQAAVKTSGRMTHARDPETGSHLDRMSRYSRLIARALAARHRLDDEYIEHVFMFSPLHDIGKLAIPDHILLKPGPLDEEERRLMRTHAERGREMIDDMLAHIGLESLQHTEILRNIAAYHHEAVNGTGYPQGRRGDQIPLEARIVAVADVFDALTSERPYKQAWNNDDAFAALEQMAGEQLDHECVRALLDHREEVEAIQRQFQENVYL
jgi:HD-GYP domain-containing protein (c-di-GMP phosphodiesterase class II)